MEEKLMKEKKHVCDECCWYYKVCECPAAMKHLQKCYVSNKKK